MPSGTRRYLVTLGSLQFHSTSVKVGTPQRTIGVSSNCLAAEPVQTVDFVSDFQQVDIDGLLKPPNVATQRAALIAELAKATNTLTVTHNYPYAGGRQTDTYSFRVFRNPGASLTYELFAQTGGAVSFGLTLNCLP